MNMIDKIKKVSIGLKRMGFEGSIDSKSFNSFYHKDKPEFSVDLYNDGEFSLEFEHGAGFQTIAIFKSNEIELFEKLWQIIIGN